MAKPRLRLFCESINMATGECYNWQAYHGVYPVCVNIRYNMWNDFVMQKYYYDPFTSENINYGI